MVNGEWSIGKNRGWLKFQFRNNDGCGGGVPNLNPLVLKFRPVNMLRHGWYAGRLLIWEDFYCYCYRVLGLNYGI